MCWGTLGIAALGLRAFPLYRASHHGLVHRSARRGASIDEPNGTALPRTRKTARRGRRLPGRRRNDPARSLSQRLQRLHRLGDAALYFSMSSRCPLSLVDVKLRIPPAQERGCPENRLRSHPNRHQGDNLRIKQLLHGGPGCTNSSNSRSSSPAGPTISCPPLRIAVIQSRAPARFRPSR